MLIRMWRNSNSDFAGGVWKMIYTHSGKYSDRFLKKLNIHSPYESANEFLSIYHAEGKFKSTRKPIHNCS